MEFWKLFISYLLSHERNFFSMNTFFFEFFTSGHSRCDTKKRSKKRSEIQASVSQELLIRLC